MRLACLLLSLHRVPPAGNSGFVTLVRPILTSVPQVWEVNDK
jgi:hypothetical protein